MTLSTATGGGSAIIQQSQGGLTLTTTGTIQGAGVIGNNGLTLTNSGTIDANTTAGTAGITLNGGGNITNTGLLEATSGGTLTVANNVVNTGANITASGTGSVVDLDWREHHGRDAHRQRRRSADDLGHDDTLGSYAGHRNRPIRSRTGPPPFWSGPLPTTARSP